MSTSSRFGSSLPARPVPPASRPGTAIRNSFSSGFASNRVGFGNFGRFQNFGNFRFHPPSAGFAFRDFDVDNFFFQSPFFFNDFFFRRPFFGCFACGFGFGGFNFGFGAPLWWGAAWPGWYAGPAYPYGLPYGYSLPYDYGLTYNSPAASGTESDNSSASSTSPLTEKSAGNSSAIVLLYLKDGTMYAVRDSWLAGGKLHYTALDGSEGVLELEMIDFQRTVDANAKRGVPFTLQPNPTSSRP